MWLTLRATCGVQISSPADLVGVTQSALDGSPAFLLQVFARSATLRAMIRALATVFLAAMLAACASHPAPDLATTPATPASAVTNALAGTPMAAYGHALNKAKNVQNIVDDQAKKQAAQIDAATGSSSH
jgi:hypothetical protein